MEFGGRKVRKRRRIEVETSYSCALQFYSSPPSGNVSLNEFDEMSIERLKILRCVERLNLSGHMKNSDDWMNKLYDDFAKNKNFIHSAEKSSSNKRDEVEAARRRDHVSHFILRLAYCRTEDLRRWFIAHETDLFRARFLHSSKNGFDMKNFIINNKLHYTPMSPEEIQKERDNLIAGSYSAVSGDMIEGQTFYKVPFIQALELVRHRKVYLSGGYAFVPHADLVILVTASFRSNLSQALVHTNRALPQLEDDERLMRLLQDFDRRYTGNDYSQKKIGDGLHITPNMIDDLSTKSFPLCMRQLNDNLRANHHLRHSGRLSYGLFLKGAGLTLEDALNFWKSHFLKKMNVDKFEKEYAYNIRFIYGKEGKRTNYTPFSCIKLITSSLGGSDECGCPFKGMDSSILRQRLTSYRLPQQAIGEIMDLASKNHYQIACQRYWEATHNASLDMGVNHPNQYFEESFKFLHGSSQPSQGKKTPHVKMNRSVMYSSQSSSQSTQMSSESTKALTQASAEVPSQNSADSLDIDTEMFDDELDDAMLEQCMDTSID